MFDDLGSIAQAQLRGIVEDHDRHDVCKSVSAYGKVCGHPSWAHGDTGHRVCRLPGEICPCSALELPHFAKPRPYDDVKYTALFHRLREERERSQ